jgi:outer membrane lipoprotein carrier protein
VLKRAIVTILIAASAQLAGASGLKSLEKFLQGTQAGQAEFTQVVTMPAKEGQAARSKTSSGSFAFQRPGRSSSSIKSRSRKPSWPTGRRCGSTTQT